MDATTVSLSQLESQLWEAANILRGPVDAADFKTSLFPLLFFKRISDVHASRITHFKFQVSSLILSSHPSTVPA